MMLRKVIIMLVLVGIVGSVHAWQSDLDTILDTYVVEDELGVVVMVNDGENSWSAARGLADLEAGTAVQVTDRFRIASMTKPFVAVLVLQLVDEGLLTLDDLILDYLPAEVIDAIENGDQVTIRQLLNMTSGIYNYVESDAYYELFYSEPLHDWNAAETVALAYDREAYFAPGEGYHYSNTNYNLLEMIIEAVTGSTLDEQLTTRIFEPLEMQDTVLESSDQLGEGIVHGYYDVDQDGALDDVTFLDDAAGLADGGIISTVADLDLFLRGLFTGELISEDSLTEMTTWVDAGNDTFYGLGMVNYNWDVVTVYGHQGNASGFKGFMNYFPEYDTTVIGFTNNNDTEVLNSIMFDTWLMVSNG